MASQLRPIRVRLALSAVAECAGPRRQARGFEPVVELRPIDVLKPFPRNARTHGIKQIQQLSASIKEFGFTAPVLVDADGEILADHARVEAAKLLGMDQVPTIRVDHLTHFLRWAAGRAHRDGEVRVTLIGRYGGVRDRYYERTGISIF